MPLDHHSKYSPSQLSRIINCPGSVSLCQDLAEPPSSSYAEEGTMQHEVVEKCLLRDILEVPKDLIKEYKLTSAHEDAINFCLDWVFDLKVMLSHDDFEESVEDRVTLKGFGKAYQDVYGTLDYSLLDLRRTALHCADWKFGRGVVVEPSTPQLKAYALGKLASRKAAKKIKTVTVYIIQPYVDEPIKSHTYTVEELLTWLTKTLGKALKEVVSDNPPFGPSVEACRWCRGAAICRARYNMANRQAATVFEVYKKVEEKGRVTVEEIAEVLDMTKDLTNYLASVKTFAFDSIKAGGEIPGYKLVEGKSTRVWNKDFEKNIKPVLLTFGLEEDELYTKKAVTPPQAEKLKKSLKKEDRFKKLIHKPAGSPTLVEDKDPRAAMTFETAEDVFAEFAEGNQ